jgi:hypothetical protein
MSQVLNCSTVEKDVQACGKKACGMKKTVKKAKKKAKK